MSFFVLLFSKSQVFIVLSYSFFGLVWKGPLKLIVFIIYDLMVNLKYDAIEDLLLKGSSAV